VGKRQAGKRAAVNNEENNCVEIVQTESEYAQWKEQQLESPTGIRENNSASEISNSRNTKTDTVGFPNEMELSA